MTKLNQIVAIEKTAKAEATKRAGTLFHDTDVPALFTGISRVYKPKDDDGDQLPPESTPVTRVATDMLDEFQKSLSHMFDIVSTKEHANTEARGDIKVDGEVILEQVPVSLLLFLEKQLTQEVRGFILKLPTLDPAFTWEPADGGGHKSQVVVTNRTQKVPRAHVLYPHSDKHPAQVQAYTEDVIVGTWDTTKLSGAIPADRKRELLDKVDRLIEGVKFAREEANSMAVTDKPIAATIFQHLFT